MDGPLYRFFAEDHRRLERLLDEAAFKAPEYDMTAYGTFRAGLLKHVKMEENILIPAAQKAGGGTPLAIAPRLRLDHGALVALLVPPPSAVIIRALRAILEGHNKLEEDAGGLYDLSEHLAGHQLDELMASLRRMPDVPVLPHKSEPFILDATKRALERAGYRWSDYEEDGRE
jgi:hypothetical protein